MRKYLVSIVKGFRTKMQRKGVLTIVDVCACMNSQRYAWKIDRTIRPNERETIDFFDGMVLKR